MDNQITLDISGLPTLATLEKAYLDIVLKKTMGNKVEAAKILGVSVKTIYNKLDLEKPPQATPEQS
jgi:DNA-binding protein Fis